MPSKARANGDIKVKQGKEIHAKVNGIGSTAPVELSVVRNSGGKLSTVPSVFTRDSK